MFCKQQNIYKSKNKYKVIYINKEKYEEIFNEVFIFEKAKEKIENMFSITLNNNETKAIDCALVDMQKDPYNISLSGNLGSGRAFFYKDIFNIKGQKTILATSLNEIYSNGKFSAPAAIKETIIANILHNELPVPSFATLAILLINENYNFTEQSLSIDDKIISKQYNYPCAIEIRIKEQNNLNRISNALYDNTTINVSNLAEKMGQIEAYKFIYRILHGSWSVGNISIDGNLIDFDTAEFVHGYFPQYSNTNKYKTNYFGFEILGCENILKLFKKFEKNNKILLENYNKYLKIYFCELMGFCYYECQNYEKEIDKMLDLFLKLSKICIKNYNNFSVYSNTNETFCFDFSNLFKYGPFNKNILQYFKLLLNDVILYKEKFSKLSQEKINIFFSDYLTDNRDLFLKEVMEFLSLYDFLLKNCSHDIQKSFVLNNTRNYLYQDQYINIINDYNQQDICKIITNIILCNQYNYKEQAAINLKLYDDCMIYFLIDKTSYKIVLEPLNNNCFDFAKIKINNIEYYMSHQNDKLISEDISLFNFSNILIKTNNGDFYIDNI